ncbi:hypothetical protein K4H00_22940, partial [Mycobacterium tuberculosis]|nr:hypothetical protein [Mycobacterium tuberculosis]
ALHLVGAGVSVEQFAAEPDRYDVPDTVIGFLRGDLGEPANGWPEPFRSRALAGRAEARPAAQLSPEDARRLDVPGDERRATLNRLLFPD